MSIYLKISSFSILLFFAFKLRTYLKKKLSSDESNDQTVDKQIVLFFPETQISSKDCFHDNYTYLISSHPSSVLCQLLSALRSSRHSLDICLFSLSFEPMIQLIQDLSQSGVIVRIVVNAQNKTESHLCEKRLQMPTQCQYLLQLFRFGVELKFITLSNDGLMHNKFAIIDNKLLINGSLNWTENSIFNCYNDCVLTTDHKLVLTYLKHFNDFWSFNSF